MDSFVKWSGIVVGAACLCIGFYYGFVRNDYPQATMFYVLALLNYNSR